MTFYPYFGLKNRIKEKKKKESNIKKKEKEKGGLRGWLTTAQPNNSIDNDKI